jgi:hypothetical protein
MCVPPLRARLCRSLLTGALFAFASSATAIAAQRPAGATSPVPARSEFVRSNLASRSSHVVERPMVRRVLVDARYTEQQNLLPSRTPLPFVAFQRVNPANGRAMNPDAAMTLPNGRHTTVREFYDQLDQAEQRLNQRGYTMRDQNTFAGVRLDRGRRSSGGRPPPIVVRRPPQPTRTGSASPAPVGGRPGPVIAARGNTGGVPPVVAPTPRRGTRVPSPSRTGTSAQAGRPGSIDRRESEMVERIRSGGAFVGEATPPPIATTTLRGNARPGSVTGEAADFAIWADALEVTSDATHAFRYTSGAPTTLVAWQVSTEPFPQDAPASYTDWQAPQGMIADGTTSCAAEPCYLSVNLAHFAGALPAEPRYYFVRVLPLWAANPTVLAGMPSNQVILRYGPGTPQEPLHMRTRSGQGAGSGTRFAFPGGEGQDFQVWMETDALTVSTGRIDGVPVGLTGHGGLLLRGRSFNPASLIDATQPRTVEYTLLGLQLGVAAGVDVTTDASFAAGSLVAPRAKVTLIAADVPFDLVNQTGSVSQPMSIECGTVSDSFNPEARAVVWFGPVPVSVFVGARIDYGVACLGKLSSDPAEVRMFVEPFVGASVYAGAGTDLVIAWASMEADLTLAEERLFLEIDTGSPNGEFSGRHELSNVLNGRMHFTAGFYHPCPPVEQVKKLWGYITGDDPVPLCTTSFDETLLDSPGLPPVSAELF